MPIDSFLDRVAILTEDTLGEQSRSLSWHLHLSLAGPALEWCWRGGRGVVLCLRICYATNCRFIQPGYDGHIRRVMRSWFQRNIDEYIQAILQLEDPLSTPLASNKLLDMLRTRISISHKRAPLRQRLSTVAQLRQAVGEQEFQDREKRWRGIFLTSLHSSSRPALNPEVSSDSEFPHSSVEEDGG